MNGQCGRGSHAAVDDVVVIMAKAPTPGRVKTRLAASVGAEAACELYVSFLRDLRRRLDGAAWDVVWAMAPPGARLEEVLPHSTGSPLCYLDQRGGDLGERMWHVFEDLFASGARRVAMLGADAPLIDAGDVGQVFAALAGKDVVLVPANDGGYCLVALARAVDVFTGVEMGGDRVLRRTLELCTANGLVCGKLASSLDVDTIEDVRDLEAAAGVDELKATQQTLAKWRRLGWL